MVRVIHLILLVQAEICKLADYIPYILVEGIDYLL
jgi:hypothetical protein